MWKKPKARPMGDRWRVYSDRLEAIGDTLEEAYLIWAYVSGIPCWLAQPRG